jgi:DNA topoisomerase-1
MRILQEIQDLPGRRLFSYVNAEGEISAVGSAHVNAYLAEAAGVAGATAKTFRTWGGTLAAFKLARSAKGTVTIKALAEAAAERLGNTPAICRASYIHPRVLALSALSGEERAALLAAVRPEGPRRLAAVERHLVGFLLSPDKAAFAASA